MSEDNLFDTNTTPVVDVFDDTGTPQEQDTIDPAKNYYEELVGEGKKFRDPEGLAKGKVEADLYIARLQRENAELRGELKTRTTLESFMDRMKDFTANTQRQPDTTPQDTMPEERTSGARGGEITQEYLEELLNQREQARKERENVEQVRAKLSELFGPNFQAEVRKRAGELGVDMDVLSNLAKRGPQAFYKVLGLDSQASATSSKVDLFSPSKPSVNSLGFAEGNKANAKNYAYYENIRKTDPNRYFTPQVQNEMYQAARTMGDAFYK